MMLSLNMLVHTKCQHMYTCKREETDMNTLCLGKIHKQTLPTKCITQMSGSDETGRHPSA